MFNIVPLNGDVQQYLKLIGLMRKTSLSIDYPSLIDDLQTDFSRANKTLVCYSKVLVGGLVYEDFGDTVLIDAIASIKKGAGREMIQKLEKMCKNAKIFTLATSNHMVPYFESFGYSLVRDIKSELIMSKFR